MKFCKKCGNPDCRDSDSYCFNCGETLVNRCDNPNCSSGDEILENFVYCPHCGELTYFGQTGYIQELEFVL